MIPVFPFVFLFALSLAGLIVWFAIASGLWPWLLIVFALYVLSRMNHPEGYQ